jgi:hypothetical protein
MFRFEISVESQHGHIAGISTAALICFMWGLRLLISRWAFRFFLLVLGWCTCRCTCIGFVCVYRPTWDAGTQSHEGDGRDRVFETDGAAHLGRQVANDGRQSPDQQYGHDEGHVTVRHVYIRHTQNSSQVVFFKQIISIICHKKKNIR